MNDSAVISAIKDLGPSIQNIMASVHSLDVVAVNAQPVPRFRREFPAWRHTLKTHWTEIKDNLVQCYNIIDSLTILISSSDSGQSSERECIDFLQEQMKSAHNLEINLRASVTQNSDISSKFAVASRRFLSSRRSSVNSIANSPINLSFQRQRPSVTPGLSPDLHDFVSNQIDAAYPDSSVASASASRYLEETGKHLTTILDFWTTLRADWQNMHVIPISRQRILDKYSYRVPSWQLALEQIVATIASIATSIDAITIEAARIPQRRRTADAFPSLMPSYMDNVAIPQNLDHPLPPLPPPRSPSYDAAPRYLGRPTVTTAPASRVARPSPSTSYMRSASASTLLKKSRRTDSSEINNQEVKYRAHNIVPSLKGFFSSSKKKGL